MKEVVSGLKKNIKLQEGKFNINKAQYSHIYMIDL